MADLANAPARPLVVVHNSVSVDGATTGFLPHLGQHYGAAESLAADARMVGSATMLSGLGFRSGEAPADPGPGSDRPPRGREDSPYWFLVDSTGRLHGRLHELRRFPGLRDVVVLVADETPREYLDHLEERDYVYHRAGDEHVLLRAALPWMRQRFGVQRLLVDSGPILTRVLLDHGLVDEVSLLVHPIAVGAGGRRLFEGSNLSHELELMSQAALDYGVVHLRYRVLGAHPALPQ